MTGHDRLSNLPDAILITILSLLKTEEVAQTCVLSKRWRDVWKFVPCLNFSDCDLRDSTGEIEGENLRRVNSFVSSFLRLRDNASDLHTFKLSHIPSSDSVSWIQYALNHNLKNLELSLSENYSFELPDDLLSCESLESLYLDIAGDDIYSLEISAPCLEYLKFKGHVECDMRFKNMSNVKKAEISFYIEDYGYEHYNSYICQLLPSLSRIENLYIESYHHLEDLSEKELPNCPTFHFLKNLTLGSFCLHCYFHSLCSFLEHCPNLETLTFIHDEYLCQDSYDDDDQEEEEIKRIHNNQLKVIDVVFSRWGMEPNMDRLKRYLVESTKGMENIQTNVEERDIPS